MNKNWNGFKPGKWQTQIDVRDFIQKNYTPYEGNADFLMGPDDNTKAVWDRCMELMAEERKKGGSANGGDDETLTRQQIDEIEPSGLGVAVFSSEDDDIKEMANALLKSELARLPEGATRKQVKETAAKVGQRIERLVGLKPPQTDDDPYKNGPVGVDTSGASEAHIKGARPKSDEECEQLAMKLAAAADAKFHKK